MAYKKQKTCWCTAYPFPHRWKAGACNTRKPHKRTRSRYNRTQRASIAARKAG